MNKFNYDAVEQKVLQFKSLSDQMEEQLEILKNELKVLQGDSIWSGEAHEYFKDTFYHLMNSAIGLSIAMKNISLFVQKIYDNYQSLENQISLGVRS